MITYMAPSEPQPQHFSNRVALYFAATRPAFLSVTLAGALIGLGTAHADGLSIDLLKAVLTVLFALVAHAGANVVNDYYDALSGCDAHNTERLFPFTGGSRLIQNGVLSVQQTRAFGYALLAIVIPAGLWLSAHSGPGLLAIGADGLLIAWAYSAPPLQLMARGTGELGHRGRLAHGSTGDRFCATRCVFSLATDDGHALRPTSGRHFVHQPVSRPRRRCSLQASARWWFRLGARAARWGYCLIVGAAYLWLAGCRTDGRCTVPLHRGGGAYCPPMLSVVAATRLVQHC
jgi:1,4-dihydroxy-2-naphthoate octaprenyltransferase